VATDWVKPDAAVWRYSTTETSATRRPIRCLRRSRAGCSAARGGDDDTTRPATTRGARRETTPDELKVFSRFAGELGFEYNVLEGFWQRWTTTSCATSRLLAAARRRAVRVGPLADLYDPVIAPRCSNDCADTGIVGLKIDFFDTEHKERSTSITRCCAKGGEHILFDFHGARNKPDRRIAHVAERDDARGGPRHGEPDHRAGGPRDDAAVHALLVGRPNTRRCSSRIVAAIRGRAPDRLDGDLSAPLLTVPRTRSDPRPPAVDVIKSIPATWDETIVLPSSRSGTGAVRAA
jgi:alpha-glucosidase